MSDLADFVLDAFRQAGGIVEPPAYGVYEVLLSEEVARRWEVPAYRRLAFAGEALGPRTLLATALIVGAVAFLQGSKVLASRGGRREPVVQGLPACAPERLR